MKWDWQKMTENMKKFIWSSINIIHMANLVAWICKRYVLIVLFLKILNLKTCQSDQENSALSQMCRSCHLDKASNWRQMPNAYLLISLLLDWKEGWLAQQFSLLNHPTFAKPRRWPKMGFTAKHLIFNMKFNIWSPVQMTWSTQKSQFFFKSFQFKKHHFLKVPKVNIVVIISSAWLSTGTHNLSQLSQSNS